MILEGHCDASGNRHGRVAKNNSPLFGVVHALSLRVGGGLPVARDRLGEVDLDVCRWFEGIILAVVAGNGELGLGAEGKDQRPQQRRDQHGTEFSGKHEIHWIVLLGVIGNGFD